MDLQVGVKIAIFREGKVLLLKRAAGKYSDIKKDRWDIVGGRINPGTSVAENLKREVLEETKMRILGAPLIIAAQDILKGPDKHVVRLTYIGEAVGEPVLDAENEEYKWMGLKDLRNLGENLDVYFKELLDNPLVVQKLKN